MGAKDSKNTIEFEKNYWDDKKDDLTQYYKDKYDVNSSNLKVELFNNNFDTLWNMTNKKKKWQKES